ncbi:MAG: acyl-CoA/acyl-ACP dehydrogenase [Proteobacteria bacterium]|nr:acyl-CoA/acyl-ACP dehydrogenase [Pseudomonadota bacterium]
MYTLQTLPGDDVRQIMWRFAERFDLQMVVQSSRSIARTTVASLVAQGARNSHEWTDLKQELLDAFDASGLTALYMNTSQGGFMDGPKNLALSLAAFELSWVDGGAATSSLASNLALAPIHEKGTPEQRDYYMSRAVPPQPGEDRTIWRGAFALTEPLPYVGVDTGVLVGKVKVKDWKDGEEPMLQVEKRGRFITNMDFAYFVTAAVDSTDERIKGSCMITLEEGDEGSFDRGAPTMKMCHQLSSTRDPIINVTVPASRIIGGYTVVDGQIVPNFTHGEIIGSVFHRTRIPVGLMTTAKLLSAVEPVIRYHRTRFRGGDASNPGSPKFEQGIQQKEDAQQRLIDIWAIGEAGASMGFTAAREADTFDPIEREKESFLAEQGCTSARKQFSMIRKKDAETMEYIDLLFDTGRDEARFAALDADVLVKFSYLDKLLGVIIPTTKLWNTGVGAIFLREAISLVGGYGITEDCPGFLMNKWADSQLEATYEGPEAVQRMHLTITQADPVFLHLLGKYADDMAASDAPGSDGLAAGIRMWLTAMTYLSENTDADGNKLYHRKRQGVTFPMADAVGWLLASYYLFKDVAELQEKGGMNPTVAEGLEGLSGFYADLAQVMAARAVGEVGRILSELVYGFNSGADVSAFAALRAEADAKLAGVRLAKDRAGQALTQVMIPEALDYPM